MRLLLDTAAILWMCDRPDLLSAVARAALVSPENELCIHQASLWELQIKSDIQRIQLSPNPRVWMDTARKKLDLTYLTLNDDAIEMLGRLPLLHKDPFDRILISTALVEGLTLVTSDTQIQRYAVPFIW
jgi:PIN domain nuclease of toxin-antitoxin system